MAGKKHIIMLTGSTGFVGSVLLSSLNGCSEFCVIPVVRHAPRDGAFQAGTVVVGDIGRATDYSEAIDSVDVIIHLAGRAHVLRDRANDSLSDFREVNVEGTLRLARQAASAGVKRFVFISSAGVNGAGSESPFSEKDIEAPYDAYSISKYEAELELRKLAAESSLELVIIRPPLVYGAGAPGSFGRLMTLLRRQIPLPFGMVNNRRSMIYVGNLVDFIISCVLHPAAANQSFLVSDGEDISLRFFVEKIRGAMGRSPWLLPVPVPIFRWVGALAGKRSFVDKLVGDFQVDSSKARNLLGWKPPFTVDQGIAATVADFNRRK